MGTLSYSKGEEKVLEWGTSSRHMVYLEREKWKGVPRLGSKHQSIWANIGRLLGFWAKIVKNTRDLSFDFDTFW